MRTILHVERPAMTDTGWSRGAERPMRNGYPRFHLDCISTLILKVQAKPQRGSGLRLLVMPEYLFKQTCQVGLPVDQCNQQPGDGAKHRF